MKQKHQNTTHNNNSTNNSATQRKISNWSSYSKSLEQRGNFTILLNTAILNNTVESTGLPGRPPTYSDAVILFLAQLRELMRLPLRQTIGVAKAILGRAGLNIDLPEYNTLSRRMSKLNIPSHLNHTYSPHSASPIIFLPDSTGLKISGEGEWKVRQHGADKRREWVKLHIGVDHGLGTIIAIEVTKSSVHDGQCLTSLIEQAEANTGQKVLETIADGAYGSQDNYKSAKKRCGRLVVPPQRNAIFHRKIPFKISKKDIMDGKASDILKRDQDDLLAGRIASEPGWEGRNEAVREIMSLGLDNKTGEVDMSKGRKEWKRKMGYHRRSLAETAMSRLKRTFGDSLRSKKRDNQVTEINIRTSLLNLFTSYGLPKYANSDPLINTG